MNVRNSYLISHAFRNYLWASLVTSAAMQLMVTVDAIVLGHFVGGNALSAINLVMPLTLLVSALSTMIGCGPAVMASKAIGNRKFSKVNMVFTTAVFQALVIGGCIGTGCRVFSNEIASMLCSNEHLLPYLTSYLKVLPWCFSLTILVSSLVSLIEADGHPQLAAKATLVGCLWHVCLEVLFVGYLDMGIQGVAYAMMVNNLMVILVFAFCIRRQKVSYSWQWPRKSIASVSISGLKEGMPMMINELVYSLMLFALNGLMGASSGERGLLYWAICVQLLMLLLFVLDIAEGAVLSIGGMLIGGKDIKGFFMLVRRLIAMIAGVVAFIVLLIFCFPYEVAQLFSNGIDMGGEWPAVVRTFSLMLVPHALSLFLRSFFQVVDCRFLGMIFSALQALCTVVGLWVAVHWAPSHIWWSFPLTAFLLLAVQLVLIGCMWCKYLKRRRDSQVDEDERQELALSVEYGKKQVTVALGQVCDFLESRAVNRVSVMAVNICCEELMFNIVSHQSYKRRPYMDLYISLYGGKVSMILKDAGRPFNPVLPMRNISLEDGGVSLGLTLVNNVCTSLSHKYMYGQNVVFAEFEVGE